MQPDSALNETDHIIRIDDYSIVVSLAVTVLMICATIFAARVYSLKPPPLPAHVPYAPVQVSGSGVAATAPVPAVPQQRPVAASAGAAQPGAAARYPVPSKAVDVAKGPTAAPPVVKRPEKIPAGVPAAEATAQTPAKKIQLEKLRGGRHEQYISIVFQLSDRIDFDAPRVSGSEIHFRLHDTETALRPSWQFKSLDSWVRLQAEEAGIDVRMGRPRRLSRINAFLMQQPDRLVVNLYDGGETIPGRRLISTQKQDLAPDSGPGAMKTASAGRPVQAPSVDSGVRLVTMRGGRHERFASIVFQFSGRVAFDPPRIGPREIRFTLRDTSSGLCPYRRYKTFESWVGLEKNGPDLQVQIGIPPHFIRLSAFLMEAPHRMVVNLYDR